VSGKTLNEFTQERLFRPLGMNHTQWRDDFTKIVPNRATAYSGSAATGFHTDMPFTNMIGNGGVLSTMSDLLRWNENLDHPSVGGQSYVDAMQTRMHLTSGRTISYALGLIVGGYRGIREVSHSGSTAGYQTFLARYPEQHVSVAVWCNYTAANPASLAHQVADLVMTGTTTAVAQASAMKVEVPSAAVAQWAGTYRDLHTDQTLTFTATEAGLSTAGGRGAGGGRGNVAWGALGRDRFASGQGEAAFGGAAGHHTLLLVRADADTARFDEVRPASAPLPLNDYVGTYASEELDVRFVVASRDGKLLLLRRPYEEFQLQPVYPDDFQAGGGLGTLRFARDANGKVSGFSFFAGRVLDVRFRRVPDRGAR
jgi:CubicO group peptidase (beta-lactamase class C family)